MPKYRQQGKISRYGACSFSRDMHYVYIFIEYYLKMRDKADSNGGLYSLLFSTMLYQFSLHFNHQCFNRQSTLANSIQPIATLQSCYHSPS
jgi:hypothetical protein